MHSTHFIYSYMVSDIKLLFQFKRKFWFFSVLHPTGTIVHNTAYSKPICETLDLMTDITINDITCSLHTIVCECVRGISCTCLIYR